VADVLEASRISKSFINYYKINGIINSLKNAVAAVKESLSFGDSFALAAA